MPNVLVLDDDPTNTTLIKMLLELEGFTVTTTADLPRAREATQADTDAFLIDCHLARGASGLDLVKDIRAGETAAAVDSAIIVTSGDVRREKDAENAGADLFLLKPYRPNALSGVINEILAAKGKHG